MFKYVLTEVRGPWGMRQRPSIPIFSIPIRYWYCVGSKTRYRYWYWYSPGLDFRYWYRYWYYWCLKFDTDTDTDTSLKSSYTSFDTNFLLKMSIYCSKSNEIYHFVRILRSAEGCKLALYYAWDLIFKKSILILILSRISILILILILSKLKFRYWYDTDTILLGQSIGFLIPIR